MHTRPWGHQIVWLMALVGWLGAAAAQNVPANTERSAVQWLQAIQNAARRLSYSGTVVQQIEGDVRVLRLVHYFDGHVSHARLHMLDGEQREFIRRADEVQCLIPSARRVVIERRPFATGFPALSAASAEEILQNYRLQIGPVDRVIDLECQVLMLNPRDALRYGYRLWVARDSGLLLRAQMLDERGHVVEQVAFTEVRIGEPIDRAQLKPSWSTEGWHVERIDARAVPIERLGWTLAVPEGFRPLSASWRRLARAGGGEAMQAVYSDGLATLSVFIETAREALPSGAGIARGSTHAFVRRVGDTLITVVGEVPPATVRKVALSAEARPSR
ncbi:MAG: MucB/RseB C-terminal domain-containing protein [Sutterellaceae bacterium]|nr:MucB/RseB C-terminal domain-containing protein [Burkholderiaceae bacterium]MCX7900959.1 MucB/RseB C-terminal domain-containing protein [Burkholderiaceae bacterium]MDW8429816.1 MucB/RseB C-terminal domain-containing protein [Sutterellaceae bacterium]